MAKNKKPLKRSLSGFEVELFTLDSNGDVAPAADEIIKESLAWHPSVIVTGEVGKHMFEIGSFPRVKVYNTALNLIENVERVVDVSEKLGYHFYPYGTYPGKFEPQFSPKTWYKMKEKIFGTQKFRLSMLVTGFHFHYTLPRGVFDKKKKLLKPMFDSKIKKTLVDSYNMLIAMDPVLTTFMQSSPFVEGRYLGKDSRMLVYRGGRKLGYDGLYSDYQQYGGLQPYKHTMADLIKLSEERHKRWKRLMSEQGFDPREIYKFGKILDFSWNPVKINKLGTMEQRGMDMNKFSLVLACGALIASTLRKIQQDFLEVVPSDVGVKEPFKLEGDKVIIPPHTTVRHYYQSISAHKGLSDDSMLDYCKRFMRFASAHAEPEEQAAFKVLYRMLESRKTESDRLVDEAQKAGYSVKEELPHELVRELALKESEKMKKDLKEARALAEKGVE